MFIAYFKYKYWILTSFAFCSAATFLAASSRCFFCKDQRSEMTGSLIFRDQRSMPDLLQGCLVGLLFRVILRWDLNALWSLVWSNNTNRMLNPIVELLDKIRRWDREISWMKFRGSICDLWSLTSTGLATKARSLIFCTCSSVWMAVRILRILIESDYPFLSFLNFPFFVSLRVENCWNAFHFITVTESCSDSPFLLYQFTVANSIKVDFQETWVFWHSHCFKDVSSTQSAV